MSHRRRQGIVCDLREQGTARIIFSKDGTKFQGVLETDSGETIALRGKCSEGTVPSTSGVPPPPVVMTVDI
ncbi:unnamed protein product, partial [Caenorhabditis auriculariae]